MIPIQHPYLSLLQADVNLRRKIPREQLIVIYEDLRSQAVHSGPILIRNEMTKQWSEFFVVLTSPYVLIFDSEEKSRALQYVSIINMCEANVCQRDSKMPGFCFKVEATNKTMCYRHGFAGDTLSRASDKVIVFRKENAASGKDWFDFFSSSFLLAHTKYTELSQLAEAQQDQLPVVTKSLSANSLRSLPPKQKAQPPLPPKPLSHSREDSGSLQTSLPVVLSTSQPPPTISPQQSLQQLQPKHQQPKQNLPQQQQNVVQQPSSQKPQQQTQPIALKQTSPPPETHQDIIHDMETIAERFSSSRYVPADNDLKEFFDAFENDEGKSIIWDLLKQVRPGMDLSQITFPSHILEPRSFLVKTVDYFAHLQYFERICAAPTPALRILGLVQWLLSGFYLMPKGIKKPYNPILGETFRTMWVHPDGSRTHLVGEQVSHHPPISAFYACNRKQGWSGNGFIKFTSVFRGLSVGIVLEGKLDIFLLAHNEHYTMTFPEACCSGFVVGPLLMEISGKSVFECAETGMRAEIDFNTKGTFFPEKYQTVDARVFAGTKEIFKVWGNYTKEVFYKDETGTTKTLLKIDEIRDHRLPRFCIDINEQGELESDKLWRKVTEAIYRNDQKTATSEKTVLEEQQRERVKEHETNGTKHVPKLFIENKQYGWKYRWFNKTPFDPSVEVLELEDQYRIFSVTRDDVALKDNTVEHAPPTALSPDVLASPQTASAHLVSPPLDTSVFETLLAHAEARIKTDIKKSFATQTATLSRINSLLIGVICLLVVLLAVVLLH